MKKNNKQINLQSDLSHKINEEMKFEDLNLKYLKGKISITEFEERARILQDNWFVYLNSLPKNP